ncbi:hypothetical protein Tsubulata_037905 [Turnera subulata]|uniref:RNA helicase n=1 Tax=Turnera subulata TaxID=218843 RepID=A0A9Q0G7H8_9ROSI|nr:hypothetical protein Tsubulata_037905 [Turnera subulata]
MSQGLLPGVSVAARPQTGPPTIAPATSTAAAASSTAARKSAFPDSSTAITVPEVTDGATIESALPFECNWQNSSMQLGNHTESPEGQKMLEFRRSLPAHKEKDALLKAISENQVVVVSGETGCGKATQLPQYILEAEIEAARRGSVISLLVPRPSSKVPSVGASWIVSVKIPGSLGFSTGPFGLSSQACGPLSILYLDQVRLGLTLASSGYPLIGAGSDRTFRIVVALSWRVRFLVVTEISELGSRKWQCFPE